jgi:hypothetical protein
MDTNSLRNYVSSTGLVEDPSIKLIGYGESNVNYLAFSDSRKVVVRTPRNDVPNKPRFENEHHFMKFIEAIGISFAPISLNYNPSMNIHIVSYVEGKNASIIDLNSKQIKLFVSHLKQLGSVEYEDYLDWCKSNNEVVHKSESTRQRTKIYIDDRIEYIQASNKDSFSSNAYEWIKDKHKILSKKHLDLTSRNTLVHGDLRWNKDGGNLRITDDKVVFIDWELSRFINGATSEFSDTLASIPINKRNKKIIRNMYDSYALGEKNSAELKIDLEYGILWSKLGNTIWAVERYCFLKNTNQSGKSRYKGLALQSIKDGDQYFNNPFASWI